MDYALLVQDEDQRLRALGFIIEAWEGATDSGVAPEMVAYAALYTALTDLVTTFGEEPVADMTRGMVQRIKDGEFTLSGPRQ